jgi:hypothetical protein
MTRANKEQTPSAGTLFFLVLVMKDTESILIL